ncbi:MAG TPA: TetR/AcrR family transcriptional regulator [Jatrophihabitans sp.]|nr:TetR/AcrR family transcriptional regulator [Jatrophihabitans sp.]
MAGQRRALMLHAALELIVKRGYADTRIAEVAKRAGTSQGLVIYHFKSRERLLTQALEYVEDRWYAIATRRMAAIATSAGRLEEFIALMCLPEGGDDAEDSWLLYLDLWAQSARNPAVAAIRQKIDDRSRETIRSLVLAAQAAGEFAAVDADDFAVTLSALLCGFVVPIALEDPTTEPSRAFELSMQYASDRLGFRWGGRRAAERAGGGGGRAVQRA